MRRILVAATLGLAAAAQAQTVDCRNPQLQIEMTYCAEQDWLAADRALNDAYRTARAQMRAIDANLPAEMRGAEAALRDAQRAWISFRDNTCAAEGWAMRGGTAEPMVIYACRARVTAARAAELRAMRIDD